MGYYIKLPPRECNECEYHASGGAFKIEFGPFWFGKDKCPECGSKDIKDYTKRAPRPAPFKTKKKNKRYKPLQI